MGSTCRAFLLRVMSRHRSLYLTLLPHVCRCKCHVRSSSTSRPTTRRRLTRALFPLWGFCVQHCYGGSKCSVLNTCSGYGTCDFNTGKCECHDVRDVAACMRWCCRRWCCRRWCCCCCCCCWRRSGGHGVVHWCSARRERTVQRSLCATTARASRTPARLIHARVMRTGTARRAPSVTCADPARRAVWSALDEVRCAFVASLGSTCW
jgi:hypothetical protein